MRILNYVLLRFISIASEHQACWYTTMLRWSMHIKASQGAVTAVGTKREHKCSYSENIVMEPRGLQHMSYGLCAENALHANQLGCDINLTERKAWSLLHWSAEGSPSRKSYLDWPQTGLDANALIKETAIKCEKQRSGKYSNESWFVTKEPEVVRL